MPSGQIKQLSALIPHIVRRIGKLDVEWNRALEPLLQGGVNEDNWRAVVRAAQSLLEVFPDVKEPLRETQETLEYLEVKARSVGQGKSASDKSAVLLPRNLINQLDQLVTEIKAQAGKLGDLWSDKDLGWELDQDIGPENWRAAETACDYLENAVDRIRQFTITAEKVIASLKDKAHAAGRIQRTAGYDSSPANPPYNPDKSVRVTVFSPEKERGRWWIESKESYPNERIALRNAEDWEKEGYVSVVWQGPFLVAKSTGISLQDAMKEATGTVNRLTQSIPRVRTILAKTVGDNMDTLTKAVMKLAHSNPELRQHLVPLLREAAAPTYQKYVEKKRKDGEKPLDKDAWERKVLNTGKAGDELKEEKEAPKSMGDLFDRVTKGWTPEQHEKALKNLEKGKEKPEPKKDEKKPEAKKDTSRDELWSRAVRVRKNNPFVKELGDPSKWTQEKVNDLKIRLKQQERKHLIPAKGAPGYEKEHQKAEDMDNAIVGLSNWQLADLEGRSHGPKDDDAPKATKKPSGGKSTVDVGDLEKSLRSKGTANFKKVKKDLGYNTPKDTEMAKAMLTKDLREYGAHKGGNAFQSATKFIKESGDSQEAKGIAKQVIQIAYIEGEGDVDVGYKKLGIPDFAKGGEKPSSGKKWHPKVKEVMEEHDLKDADAEEVKEFKGDKPSTGKPVPDAELLRRFLQKAKPETKERMKGVSPAEFKQMLGAIMKDEE